MASLPILTTNEVELTPVCSPSLSAVFNRGIISTQHVVNALKGHIDPNSFKNTISKPGNPLRIGSGRGDYRDAHRLFRTRQEGRHHLCGFVRTNRRGADCGVGGCGEALNIVVADIAAVKAKGGEAASPPENDVAWDQISKTAKASYYRAPPSGHIVHNKFLIYVDGSGPQAVLTGSLNWTDTGLCAQTNNSIVIQDKNGGGEVSGLLEEAAGGRDRA